MKSLRSIGVTAFCVAVLLALSLSQAEAAGQPVFSPPYDVELFVRGSFNSWGLGSEMKFDSTDNEYVAYVELTQGGHAFKIASEDWLTVDLGFADDGIAELGVPEPLTTTPGYGNVYIEVAYPGVYSFRLDVSDLGNPSVLVEYARPGGDGTDRYTQFYAGAMYFFDCLGAASPVVTDITVNGGLHARQTPAGGFIYRDIVQIDGVGYDQYGREYRMNLTAPLVFNGKPNGSSTFSNVATATFIAQDDGPNLHFRYLEKLTYGPNGEVRREFVFYEEACSE